MSLSLSRFRSQLESVRHPTRPRATRYGADLRARVVAAARRECRRGRAVATVAREVGLPVETLSTWLRRKPVARLRPVEIASSPIPPLARPEVVVTVSGLRIEGLDLAGIVALVRALS